jgi:LmbE family N-acetylglucosaminyl deacetylase
VLDVLRGPVLVISPHLDDAALSLGATIYTLARTQEVCILTVFANDPESELPAQPWDEYCGFASAAAAARGRRAEDTAASRILGAQVRWLPFADSSHSLEPDDPSEIRQAIAAAVRNAETVLAPGYPLAHPDHAMVSSLTAEACAETNCRLGFYVEQPYASRALLSSGRIEQEAGERFHEAQRLICFAAGGWRRSGSVYAPPSAQPKGTREGRWAHPTATGAAAWIAKHRAISAYRSQVNFRFHARVVLGEIGTGGEYVWWACG